ncbi:hypothetical protein PGJ35_002656 [Enterococcus faecalis]|uniref:hypothetical protein n=1 Tax=Enterococcus faecalis TaxID=1351 RepID=UPI002A50F9BF|nr:hypothetical protein [Enterococcus faecalis]HCJ1288657.1 hypothetical protein [Enterococcus faecalis]
MKLIDLVNILEPDVDITFEIVEETAPAGYYVKDILKKYPYAINYSVISIYPAWYTDSNEKVIPTLGIEVSNKVEE